MAFDINSLEECGLNTEAGIGYTGNTEKYITALQRFVKSYDQNRARVMDALKVMNVEDYTIIVHSLKSNSRMIGAEELSSGFQALEMAAREGDKQVIISDTFTVLNSGDILVEQLRAMDDTCSPAAVRTESVTAEEAQNIISGLLEALDEYDDELSAELAKKLSGYPFTDKDRKMLEKASGLIDNFMYDDAAEIIRQLSPALK
jgi:HPt (histidine-containing phosphotransfer) domain-containing protein